MSPHSGRMIVAQQFTAGIGSEKIVVREADGWNRSSQIDASVVRFTDFISHACHPSDESLGYFQSSAKRGLGRNTCAKRSTV
jgi:hypothetical protein